MEHPTGADPALVGETHVTNVTFHRFLSSPASSYVLETLMRFGVGHVISNRPLHVRALARALCRGRGGVELEARHGAAAGGVETALNCATRGSHSCTV